MPLRPTPYESWSGGYVRVDGRDIRANTAYMWGHILAATDIRISTEFDSASSTTAGIQEAINDLPATGGMVFIPAGTHTITSIIQLKPNVSISGAGKSTVIVRGAAIDYVFEFPSGTTYSSIQDVVVNGNSGAFAGQVSIRINASSHIRIRCCELYADKDGIKCEQVAGGLHTVWIEDCYIHNMSGYGIRYMAAGRAWIVNNYVDTTGNHGIYIDGSFDCQVRGNYVRASVNSGIRLSGGAPCKGNRVDENICESCKEGIRLHQTGPNIISHNTCFNNTEYGIREYGVGDVVSFNVCYDNAIAGIYVPGTFMDGVSVLLIGNQCWQWAAVQNYGILITATTFGAKIFGNNCSLNTVADIEVPDNTNFNYIAHNTNFDPLTYLPRP